MFTLNASGSLGSNEPEDIVGVNFYFTRVNGERDTCDDNQDSPGS